MKNKDIINKINTLESKIDKIINMLQVDNVLIVDGGKKETLYENVSSRTEIDELKEKMTKYEKKITRITQLSKYFQMIIKQSRSIDWQLLRYVSDILNIDSIFHIIPFLF